MSENWNIKIAVTFSIGIILGGFGAFYIAPRTYQQRIQSYKGEISDLTTQITVLSSTGSNTEVTASEYEILISSLEAERSNYTSRISDLEAKFSDMEVAIKNYENETSKLESQISTLEAEKTNYETQTSQLKEDLADAKITIEEYKIKASKLESQVSNLELEIASLSTTLSSYESEIETLRKDLSSYEEEIAQINAQVAHYKSETANLQGKIDSQTNQINELNSRLDKILDIDVTQRYEWVYGSWLWSDRYQWELTIPLSLYCEYYERPKPASWRDWVDMAKDRKDDAYIDEMVQEINQVAWSEGFTEAEKVNFVIAFVQVLPFTVDEVTTPWNEYPRYPIETLFDRGGDCEDTSILVAALLDRMGYDVALLFLSDEKHCAVGVSIEGNHGSYYSCEGKKYFYLETTGENYEIGEIPSELKETSAYIYPLHL